MILHSCPQPLPLSSRLIGILAFGEGWHNNHHAFEYSSRHGLEWWQVDTTWYFVKALETVGLASKLRYPRPQHMQKLSFPDAATAGSTN